MKFKVGDKVRYIKKIIYHNVKIGGIFQIISISNGDSVPYLAKSQNGNRQWFIEEELEKVEYTYEDLKKSPLGTKITFVNGKVLVKDDEERYENHGTYRLNKELEGMKDNCDYGKIIKIEEPIYQTVYESKLEILDEVEKRYLSNVIRPFRNKVKSIKKTDNYMNGTKNQYITITYKDDYSTDFPNFRPNTMYKGMKEYKEYTLEELGL